MSFWISSKPLEVGLHLSTRLQADLEYLPRDASVSFTLQTKSFPAVTSVMYSRRKIPSCRVESIKLGKLFPIAGGIQFLEADPDVRVYETCRRWKDSPGGCFQGLKTLRFDILLGYFFGVVYFF